jgi:outer membrane protein TolC
MGPLATAARDLAAAGETDPGTARLFSIEVGRKKALKASLEIGLVGRRARIFRLMGLVPEATAELIPDVNEFPQPDIGTLAVEHIAALHPAVVRRRADYDAAESRLRLELRKQYPDITFAPSFSGERDETTFNLGFGLPIPVWNSNRQGIADALGLREIARLEVESAIVSAAEDIAVAQSKFSAAKAHREGLDADVVPDLDKQIQEAQALMSSGELDLVTLFQVLQQAYEVKLEILAALSDEQFAAGIVHQFLALQLSESAKEEK